MAKKLILDIDEKTWDDVKIFGIRKKLNNNEAVVKLIRLGLSKA